MGVDHLWSSFLFLSLEPELIREAPFLLNTASQLRGLLRDRNCGACVIEFPQGREQDPQFVTFVSYLISSSLGTILQETRNTNALPMSGLDFVQIQLRSLAKYSADGMHFDNPHLCWPLHTDRCLHQDVGDFLTVCKLKESEDPGGAIRLLHIDDFSRCDEFLQNNLAKTPLGWKGEVRFAPLSRQREARASSEVLAPVFTEDSVAGLCVRFTDHRFRRPKSVEQSAYLDALGQAFSDEANTVPSFTLPVNAMYVVNNRWYLHGREGFRVNSQFERVLLRYCGNFA